MADQPRHLLLLIGLSISQVMSWGTLYYVLPATSTAIAQDTGWSVVLITTAFSAGSILSAAAGIPVGRLLDRAGPRLAMTVGTIVGAVGFVAVAVAPSFPLFVAAWCVVGLGQSATLYQAAFTVINTTFGLRRGTALTVVTLAAGLASTISAPIAVALTRGSGWRGSFLVLAGILLVTVAPIHATLLPGRWLHDEGVPGTAVRTDPRRVRRIARSRPFLLLQIGVTGLALALYALTINLVPLLTSAGLAAAAAAANTGHLTGIFAAPVTIATAIAPAVGAALLQVTDGAIAALLCAAAAVIGGGALLLGTTTHRDPRVVTRHRTHR